MFSSFPPSWQSFLASEQEKPYFQTLLRDVDQEYARYPNEIFPKRAFIFRAFMLCPLAELKVVILGQDPYPTAGYADGLCFSHPDSVLPRAKSLTNIFIEFTTDMSLRETPSSDLSNWAKQGVLLLNSILTVRKGKPQSHKKMGWELFTDAVIDHISKEKEHVVFLLWGEYAKKKGVNIDRNKHLVLTSGHPSPMSANRGKWFGNKHFSQTIAYLQEKKGCTIWL